MTNVLSKQAQKVQEALNSFGVSLHVLELPDSARTSPEAAAAIGCSVSRIAKSLVFKGVQSEVPYLIIASGSNRVDERLVSKKIGEQIAIADADYVRSVTGYVIGGIPPVGHSVMFQTFIDADLMQYDTIWAAAGTPHAVFELTPKELVRITNGTLIQVTTPADP